MKIESNAAQTIGMIFIIVGILAFIVILISFDWGYYNDIKHLTYTYAEEIAYMKEQLVDTWITAIVLLVGSATAGVVIMTLGKILGVLEVIAIRSNKTNEQTED